MSVIALIPARGNSKRILKKNLQIVGRHCLVCRAIKTAFETKLFDRVILSTDTDEIAKHAQSYFNDLTIFMRPHELAQDDTPMLPVLRHAAEEHAKRFLNPPDDIILLQPTSPFRTVDDIKAAYTLYKNRGADAVVSVTAPERDLVFRIGHAGRMRAEPNVVVPNGAIYILWGGALACGHDWYSGISYAYPMPKERSLDIVGPVSLITSRAVEEHVHAKVRHSEDSQSHHIYSSQETP